MGQLVWRRQRVRGLLGLRELLLQHRLQEVDLFFERGDLARRGGELPCEFSQRLLVDRHLLELSLKHCLLFRQRADLLLLLVEAFFQRLLLPRQQLDLLLEAAQLLGVLSADWRAQLAEEHLGRLDNGRLTVRIIG